MNPNEINAVVDMLSDAFEKVLINSLFQATVSNKKTHLADFKTCFFSFISPESIKAGFI